MSEQAVEEAREALDYAIGYENCITVLHAFHEFPEKAVEDCETPSCVEFCKAEATIPVVKEERDQIE